LSEVGIFEAEVFEPDQWKPDLPNSAMANLTRRDGYWAAKVVSAFTADGLRVILRQALYQDPRAEQYLLDALLARQARIVAHWFDEVPPLDFFQADANGVSYHDLAVERGFAPVDGNAYRYRLAAVDDDRQGAFGEWTETAATRIPLRDAAGRSLAGVPDTSADRPFLALEVQLNRGGGWTRSTTAYLATASRRIVALDR
jgi:hypothetical protein